jgi:phage baseplate assembly protein W
MAVRTPHFRTPFSIVDGAPAEVEQDSDREIDQCIEAVLRTPVGTRIEDPEFGRPDETFKALGSNPSAEPYVTAVEEGEPRARVRGTARVEEMVEEILIEREDERV